MPHAMYAGTADAQAPILGAVFRRNQAPAERDAIPIALSPVGLAVPVAVHAHVIEFLLRDSALRHAQDRVVTQLQLISQKLFSR
jgi:hypothetical protein